jgi:hypothetical protein
MLRRYEKVRKEPKEISFFNTPKEILNTPRVFSITPKVLDPTPSRLIHHSHSTKDHSYNSLSSKKYAAMH